MQLNGALRAFLKYPNIYVSILSNAVHWQALKYNQGFILTSWEIKSGM